MKFIHHSKIPINKKVACSGIACSIIPQKVETYRTRMIIGRNTLDYYDSTKVPTEDLMTMKILLNSVISTPGVKCMTIGIKNLLKKRSKRKTTKVYSRRVNARINYDTMKLRF